MKFIIMEGGKEREVGKGGQNKEINGEIKKGRMSCGQAARYGVQASLSWASGQGWLVLSR